MIMTTLFTIALCYFMAGLFYAVLVTPAEKGKPYPPIRFYWNTITWLPQLLLKGLFRLLQAVSEIA